MASFTNLSMRSLENYKEAEARKILIGLTAFTVISFVLPVFSITLVLIHYGLLLGGILLIRVSHLARNLWFRSISTVLLFSTNEANVYTDSFERHYCQGNGKFH